MFQFKCLYYNITIKTRPLQNLNKDRDDLLETLKYVHNNDLSDAKIMNVSAELVIKLEIQKSKLEHMIKSIKTNDRINSVALVRYRVYTLTN